MLLSSVVQFDFLDLFLLNNLVKHFFFGELVKHSSLFSDNRIGVQAAKAAGMKVEVVPSQYEADAVALADSALSSLADFLPEFWGLPSFKASNLMINGLNDALPVNPICLEGKLVDALITEV